MRQTGLWLLWIVFLVYGFGFAPADQSDTVDLIVSLSTFDWGETNSLIAVLFTIMGLWPMVYAAVVLVDGRSQSIPAWPFVALSFGFGAFALLPYLALRRDNPSFSGPKSRLLGLTESPWLALVLLFSGAGLMLFGFVDGSWVEFIEQWQTNRFIHVMSLDFCLLCLLFLLLLPDDMARRGMEPNWLWFLVTLIPFIGPALYLCLRSPLVDTSLEQPIDPAVEAVVSLDA